MSILGTRVVRTEDPQFLTRGAVYTDDLTDERLTGALHATFVRSQVAHAKILSVDTEAAKQAPGVVAVYTAADLTDLPPLAPPFPFIAAEFERQWLCTDTVRFVGELIAAVVAETRTQAVDAAEAVVVDRQFYGHDQLVCLQLRSGLRLHSRRLGFPAWHPGDHVRVWIDGPVTALAAEPQLAGSAR